MKNVLRVVILTLLTFLPFRQTAAMGQFFEMENIHLGRQAPDFTLKTLGGKSTVMSQYRAGQPAIVFFWATWCPHCREALEDLNNRKDQLAQKGIKVILVDLGESIEEVRPHIQKNKIGFEVFLDEDTSLAEAYGIIGVPTFFLLNKDGMVQAVEHELPQDYEQLLLKSSAQAAK